MKYLAISILLILCSCSGKPFLSYTIREQGGYQDIPVYKICTKEYGNLYFIADQYEAEGEWIRFKLVSVRKR